jgi:hypothetical protein
MAAQNGKGLPPDLVQQFLATAEAMIEARRQLGPELQRMAMLVSQAHAEIGIAVKQIAPVFQQISEAGREFHRQIAPYLPALLRVAEELRELPERNRRITRMLAQHGWYIDPHATAADVEQWAEMLSEGPVDLAQERLCVHFDATAPLLLAQLVEEFPGRGGLLRSAFGAHARGDYACSVPLFLAQADGICFEIVNEQLYARRGGVPRLATVLRTIDEDFFLASVIAPLVEAMPLSAPASERKNLPSNILNRHAVLHGESLDYDTRLNSCRCVSLLGYIAWVFTRHRRMKSR